MGMKTVESLRRPGLAVILRWSGALVGLGLLMVALLSLPLQPYAVRTGSMEPAFGPRDVVIVHTGEFKQGQPITFTHDGTVITHRLVSLYADGTFATRGDANRTADPWVVQRSDVIGGVVASAPNLGYWLVYLKSITGLGSVIFAGLVPCLLWSIAREFDESPARRGPSPHPRGNVLEVERALA